MQARTPSGHPTIPASDKETRALLEKVLTTYYELTDLQLASLCHARGTPWWSNWHQGRPKRPGQQIPDALIRAHFEAQAQAA